MIESLARKYLDYSNFKSITIETRFTFVNPISHGGLSKPVFVLVGQTKSAVLKRMLQRIDLIGFYAVG